MGERERESFANKEKIDLVDGGSWSGRLLKPSQMPVFLGYDECAPVKVMAIVLLRRQLGA